MARRNNDNNPLQLSLRVNSLPKTITPKRYYTRLIQFITEGKELPPSWDVQVQWRNKGTRHFAGNTSWKWNAGDFETVVSDSADRGGFNSILLGVLQQRLEKFTR